MRKTITACFFFMICLGLGTPTVRAQTPPTQLQVFSKEAAIVSTQQGLQAVLQSNVTSDQTAMVIPNGSTLVVERLDRQVNAQGVGTFSGAARLALPDGRVIAQGRLFGTVGLTAQREPGGDNRRVGRLEGWLELGPEARGRDADTTTLDDLEAEDNPNQVTAPGLFTVTASFVADEIFGSGALPGYRARLDGILAAVQPPQRTVALSFDKRSYQPTDPVVVTIRNQTNQAIQAVDGQSYCTVLQVDRIELPRPQTVGNCPLGRPSVPVTIRAGDTLTVTLPVEDFLRQRRTLGAYRVTLRYRMLNPAGNPTGRTNTVSAGFVVGTTTPPPTVTGAVSISVNQERFSLNDQIVATLSNGLTTTIQTQDHRSFCSVFFLERRNDRGEWEGVAPCLLRIATRQVRIAPQQTLTQRLQLQATRPQIPAGDYRLRTLYVVLDAAGNFAGDTVEVTSAPFRIQ